MKTAKLIPAIMLSCLVLPVFAQSVSSEMQRDVKQQQRIESGLKSGQLTTREAGKLEHEEAQINRTEANALKDGKLSDAEKNRIQKMQNKVSRDIHAQKHDAQIGNHDSASSKRMQADVQRNINQGKRIKAGVSNGSLTNHEAGKLERGQAKDDRKEARVGHDGFVSAREQRQVQRSENRQSRRIHREKTDGQNRS
ncbi:MAG: hypothetical protein JWQ21_1357 [Herminiimonas sp.]|nr:hypothetical protein [Herminiimonas sp.]